MGKSKKKRKNLESASVAMNIVKEQEGVVKNEESTLDNVEEKNVSEKEIDEQQNTADNSNVELDKPDTSNENIGKDFLRFNVVDDETDERTEQKKKIAFVKNNRPINPKKVDGFIAIIASEKYEKAYPIIVVNAKKLIEAGYEVVSIDGNILTEEEAENYFVIIDGQHRSVAFAKLFATGEYDGVIPNVHVRDIENVGEYLVDINNVGSSWDKKEKLIVTSLTAKEQLFKSVANLLNEGFNPSTTMLIYTSKNLPQKQIDNALKGNEVTFPKGTKIDIERGDKFVNLCKAANMDVSFITKRYFIKGFNSYASATSENKAFKALDKLKGLNLDNRKLKSIKDDLDFVEMLKEASKK
jgi:hypothetical protein